MEMKPLSAPRCPLSMSARGLRSSLVLLQVYTRVISMNRQHLALPVDNIEVCVAHQACCGVRVFVSLTLSRMSSRCMSFRVVREPSPLTSDDHGGNRTTRGSHFLSARNIQ